MKKLFLLITLIANLSFANDELQMQTENYWKPIGYTEMSEYQKQLISGMTPLNDRTKPFVQLLLEAGKFKDCGMGATLTSNNIYFAVVDKKTSKKSQYVLKVNETLVSEQPIFNGYDGKEIYILIFDQKTKDKDVLSETIFVFFYMAADRSGIEEVQIGSIKNMVNKNLITQFYKKVVVAPSDQMISCKTK